MIITSRRSVLLGLVAAPMVLRLGIHMPIRSWSIGPYSDVTHNEIMEEIAKTMGIPARMLLGPVVIDGSSHAALDPLISPWYNLD